MKESNSYRQILKSSSIVGGASLLNIAISLIRTKIAAVLLGPSGIGLIGILQSLMATASAVTACGISNVGTRQIAEAIGRGDRATVWVVRHALLVGVSFLAVSGSAVFWIFSDVLAEHALGDVKRTNDVRFLALGVMFGVAATAPVALLNGMRQIGNLAKSNVLAGIGSAILGVTALFLWGEKGVVAFVIVAPLSTLMAAFFFARKIFHEEIKSIHSRELVKQWKTMLRLGFAFMLSGVVTLLGQFLVRTIIKHELGDAALGYFQAAWTVSMTYIGMALASMGADYYPRLTGVIHDKSSANKLVNEQTEVALLIAGPILLFVVGAAPWFVKLLYSDAFGDSVGILQWLVLGDILKVVSWPLGFVILACGDGKRFLLTEIIGSATIVASTLVGISLIGLVATGVAYFIMYLIYMPCVLWFAYKKIGFVWHFSNVAIFVFLLASAFLILISAYFSEAASVALGMCFSAGFSIFSVARLERMGNFGGPVGRLVSYSHRLRDKFRR